MSVHTHRPALAASLVALLGALTVTPAAAHSTAARTIAWSRAPAVADVPGGVQAIDLAGCAAVRFYIVWNPSMNKPRGHQEAPDHWSWASGC